MPIARSGLGYGRWKKRGSNVTATLPFGVATEVDSAAALTVSQQSGVTLESDWTARSTASGVFFAERFNDGSRLVLAQAAGGSDPNGYIWTVPANISHDTTIKRSGGGSAKIAIPASSDSDPGSLRLPIGQLRGNGTTTYYQYSIYTPTAFLQFKPTYTGSSGGWKSAIISHTLSSNQNNEVVVQDTERRGFPHLYWQDGNVTAVTADESRSTPCNAVNFAFTPEVDTGTPSSPATCAEYEQRYGPIFTAPHLIDDSTPDPGTDVFARGYPSPQAQKAVRTWVPNGWYTVLVKVTIGTLGTNSSTIDVWGCPTGMAYQHLIQATGIRLGTANSGHNAIWLLPYETGRNGNSVPQSTHMNFAEVIVSSQAIAAPMTSGNSSLKAAAAAMSSNTWAGLTVSGLSQSLITRGDSDSILSYAKPASWDAARRRMYFYGSTHGTLHRKRMIRYVEETNTWETDHDGAPESDGANSHGYYHFTIRPENGEQFIRHYDSATVSRRFPGGSWSAAQPVPGSMFVDFNVADSLVWHPGLNAGAGGLVFASCSRCYTSNVTVSSWTQHGGSLGSAGGQSNGAVYNPETGCVFFSGGTDSNKFWRLAADGTLSQRASSPVSIGPSSAEGQAGLFSAGTGKPFIVLADGTIREFDDASNTWSGTVTTLPFTASEDVFFACPVDEYGIVAFVWLSAGLTPSSTMYLWKR